MINITRRIFAIYDNLSKGSIAVLTHHISIQIAR